MISKIIIQEKIKEINKRPWYPLEVARVNNQIIRIALFFGEFHWHNHANEDELFYVIEGELIIQMKKPYSDLILKKGEMAVIPKGVEHCPKSNIETYVLMFEPINLESFGN
jgi:mannose-6-phosphate isomerase-like protein (cupin superfamily)